MAVEREGEEALAHKGVGRWSQQARGRAGDEVQSPAISAAPEVKDDGVEAMQGVRARFLRLGEAELNGGAGGHDGGVRRWLWPRQRRAAAMVAFGGVA